MNTSRALRFALLANLSLVAGGCGVFGSANDDNGGASANAPPATNPGEHKAVAVGGPADPSELTEKFGVFVTPSGAAAGDGTRAHPLGTIQAAIDLGKSVGKRVYVCAGTYKEALVLADSISVIGGLDCSDANEWRTGMGFSQIESPTSPAIRAKEMPTATRLEGLDIVAPNAGAPSASSIGLVAEHANVTIARSKITAGNGADGVDGVEGAQLSSSPSSSIDGAPFFTTAQCDAATTCISSGGIWYAPPARAGGVNACDGMPGHAGGAGGTGGEGGIYKEVPIANDAWVVQYNHPATPGQRAGEGLDGQGGPDGANAAPIGKIAFEGYTPADGLVGQDGAPGGGGAGGDGASPKATLADGSQDDHYWWRGFGGAGGGAGGCPGLAGTPGTGGGASIAVVVLDSTVAFDGTEVVSARGGNGGHGTLGSDGTAGGKGGDGGFPTLTAFAFGKPGGHGGSAGVSGHGASGPSLGIAVHGAIPSLDGGSRVIVGPGGDAIQAASRIDAFGTKKTIPAAAQGVSKDILVL